MPTAFNLLFTNDQEKPPGVRVWGCTDTPSLFPQLSHSGQNEFGSQTAKMTNHYNVCLVSKEISQITKLVGNKKCYYLKLQNCTPVNLTFTNLKYW